MANVAEINKAIAAHGNWKRRLADAIESGTDMATPAQVRLDNTCDFGRWLYAADLATRQEPNYGKVLQAHADFHVAAASVLAMALSGRKADAHAAMSIGSAFARASANITNAMITWRTASGG